LRDSADRSFACCVITKQIQWFGVPFPFLCGFIFWSRLSLSSPLEYLILGALLAVPRYLFDSMIVDCSFLSSVFSLSQLGKERSIKSHRQIEIEKKSRIDILTSSIIDCLSIAFIFAAIL
jgi:hypothetical protein